MNLFSEVYGCYFTVIARILEQAQKGMKRQEIEELVHSHGFYDTAFHLLPKLLSGEWDLLELTVDGTYYAKTKALEVKRPMTNLELAWIKSLLSDARILLFLTEDEYWQLNEALCKIEPLFHADDFYIFDSAKDADAYDTKSYIRNFKVILEACKLKKPLRIYYENARQKRMTKIVVPYKINYSGRDDKFRLLGAMALKGEHYKKITLNLGRIREAEMVDMDLPKDFQVENYFEHTYNESPIILRISKERNALERCMLQFASWEKQTEYEEENDCYICKIFYDKQDETELLIRILGFGPVVKVLGPVNFLNQIKERVQKQYDLISS